MKNLFLIMALIFPATALAEAQYLRYQVYWGGLHAADLALSADFTSERGNDSFDLETRGLIDALIRLKVEATSAGTDFLVEYTNRRRERRIEVSFPADGSPALPRHSTLAKDDDDDDRIEDDDPLDPQWRIGVIDPLAALGMAIRRLKEHLEGGPDAFTIGVFDGRRRFDINGRFVGTGERRIGEVRHEVYRLRLTIKAVAGFRPNHKRFWDDVGFDIAISRDGRFTPLAVDWLGPGPVITIVETCAQPCRLVRK